MRGTPDASKKNKKKNDIEKPLKCQNVDIINISIFQIKLNYIKLKQLVSHKQTRQVKAKI